MTLHLSIFPWNLFENETIGATLARLFSVDSGRYNKPLYKSSLLGALNNSLFTNR